MISKMVFLQFMLQFMTFVGLIALGLLLYRYLPSYAAQKGRNLACPCKNLIRMVRVADRACL